MMSYSIPPEKKSIVVASTVALNIIDSITAGLSTMCRPDVIG